LKEVNVIIVGLLWLWKSGFRDGKKPRKEYNDVCAASNLSQATNLDSVQYDAVGVSSTSTILCPLEDQYKTPGDRKRASR
jgi:hypothetical protein